MTITSDPIVNAATLEALPIEDLRTLFDAATRAANAYLDILNQPRADREAPAHQVLCELLDRADNYRTLIIDEMRKRTPEDKRVAEIRAEVLTAWEVDSGDYTAAMRHLADMIGFSA